jgi:TRAP-type C4-dicarboxylate transport system substrate-binding protein
LGAGVAVGADKTFELRLAHWVPPSHPLQKALEDWGASVEKASNGTIKYKVYPSQQLGKAFDHYDMARDGIADLTYVNPGYQPGRFPIIGAGELPFLIANAKGGSQALDAWYRKHAEKEMKDVKFCLAFVHDPGSFHSKVKKIVVPGDIKGMKIRPAHATMATFVTQLGGTNVQSSAPEGARHPREGRRRRGDLPVGLGAAVRHRQGHQVPHGGAALRDDLRVRVQQDDLRPDVGDAEEGDRRSLHPTNGPGKVAGPWADFEHAGIAKLKAEAGHEVYTLSDAQLCRVRKAAEPLQKELGRQRQEGGRRSRRHHEGPEGVAREVSARAY